MKITELEGNPQEILEYQQHQQQQQITVRKFPTAVRQLTKREINQQSFREDRKEYGKHWSRNKQQWVNISEMNSSYILNVMRLMLREGKNEDLLTNEEFQSLAINLVDNMIEGE